VASVAQRLQFVGNEAGKLLALRQAVADGLRPPVLVFVSSKDRALELHRRAAPTLYLKRRNVVARNSMLQLLAAC